MKKEERGGGRRRQRNNGYVILQRASILCSGRIDRCEPARGNVNVPANWCVTCIHSLVSAHFTGATESKLTFNYHEILLHRQQKNTKLRRIPGKVFDLISVVKMIFFKMRASGWFSEAHSGIQGDEMCVQIFLGPNHPMPFSGSSVISGFSICLSLFYPHSEVCVYDGFMVPEWTPFSYRLTWVTRCSSAILSFQNAMKHHRIHVSYFWQTIV